MDLEKSVLFASIMTLMNEIDNNGKAVHPLETACHVGNAMSLHYCGEQEKERLCRMAQELLDEADAACGTKAEVSGVEIVPVVINGILYEAVCAIEGTDAEKKVTYQTGLELSHVDSGFAWEYVAPGEGELAETLVNLTGTGMDLIIAAASRVERGEAGIGFVKALVEFMLFLEEALMKQCALCSMPKRPPVLVLEKAARAMEKEIKRMEEEDPSLPEQLTNNEKQAENLRAKARMERDAKNMSGAAEYYKELLYTDPDDWEAQFYSVLCSVYGSANTIDVFQILASTRSIVDCVPNAIWQARKKLSTQMEKITELGGVAASACELASKFFVASMDLYRRSGRDYMAENTMVYQVNAIIQMLFAVGDAIEKNFGEDYEVCKNTCCPCWKIAFSCYESCPMGVPVNLYDHFLRIVKYDPSFRCTKPLVKKSQNNSQGEGGCYIATAVYGSYDCPEVWTLRRFRDQMLARTGVGRAFICFYYAISPTMVRWFGKTGWFRKFWKALLDQMVAGLMERGVENTPYQDRNWRLR